MSDDHLLELERRWRQSGTAADELALVTARARRAQWDVAALLRLAGEDAAHVRLVAAECLAELPAAQATRARLQEVAGSLAGPAGAAAAGALCALGRRGVDLSPAVERAIELVGSEASGSEPAAALALLEQVAAALSDPASGWQALDIRPCAAALASLVFRHDPGPAAEVAVDLLLHGAPRAAQSVAASLVVRWSQGRGPAFARLLAGLEPLDPALFTPSQPPRPERLPLSVEAVLAQVPPGAGAVLVAIGQESPASARSERVGLLREGELLCDGWVAARDIDLVVEGLRARGGVRRGQWDVLYATPWSLAWTEDGGPLEVWSPGGRVLLQRGDQLVTPGRTLPSSEVARVHAYLSPDWVTRGVRCVLADGGALPIHEVREQFAQLDPTYDAIDLLFDASWVQALSRAVGAALGVPVERDPDLTISAPG